MKRYIILIAAALTLAVMLSGCTNNKNNTSSPGGTASGGVVSDIMNGVSSMASTVEEDVSSIGSEIMPDENGDNAGNVESGEEASK